MPPTDRPVVLAVDDDEDVLETYRLWLGADMELRTAIDGDEALERLDEEVDVVLLDRMMSGRSGEDVLGRIRDREGSYRVLMATAVDPDFDLLAMEFDGYLLKPMTREQLLDAIETVQRWDRYAPQVQEYLRARSTLEVLEATKKEGTLEESETYADLEAEVNELRSALDDDVETLETATL